MSNYEKKCCDCKNLNREDYYRPFLSSEKIYKCKVYKDYYPLTRDASDCPNFADKNPSSGDFTPTGFGNEGFKCLSTLVFFLKSGELFDDKCKPLETLRQLREQILRKNPKYYPLLDKYDELSPQICRYLQFDIITCLITLKKYLLPLCKLARNALLLNNEEQKDYINGFVELFNNMLEYLRNKYGISEYVPQSSFTTPPLGKGRRLAIENQ